RGGEDRLAELMPVPSSPEELIGLSDDRYLSQMCLRVFSAGLKHSLVLSKWPAFEEVFHGFVPGRVTLMNDEEMEACMGNRALIRHWAKISSVRANAAAMQKITKEHGSFGQWLAEWPADDTMGLWDRLAKDFTQLGGNSGPYFLRMISKDTFVLTGDVVQGLIDNKVVAKKPTTKPDRKKVQDAFNGWAAETGRPLCQLSRILALSVG
ncbi:MAG: DNA-3-methyladenine glycosylase I, partial [Rhodospirillaceae bacterium]|nr:DNA-3-methyladenine glycosylase I [Rhodospirillaceae bacterium]